MSACVAEVLIGPDREDPCSEWESVEEQFIPLFVVVRKPGWMVETVPDVAWRN